MSKMKILSCKEYVKTLKQQLKEKISTFENRPKLCVIQIGNDLASNTYIRNKKKIAEEVGIACEHIHINEDMSQKALESLIKCQDSKCNVDGIIIQLPIPDKYDIEKLQQCISPEKDVDGFRPDSCFKPCTPKGIIDWLKFNNYDLNGKNVTVLGRSKIVGKPLVNMLIDEGATATCCNSHTRNLGFHTMTADIVVSAIGKSKYLKRHFSSEQIIVDVGINRDEDGKLCGDVDCEFVEEYYNDTYVTPVPGGVGLLTTATLMKNVVQAYELQNK